MNKTIEPLNSEVLKKRVLESFPSTYLTIISIIQGVAMGILASNSLNYISDIFSGEKQGNFYAIFPYTFFCFFSIVIVSYQYVWFMGVFRWPPRFWDTLTPFALGFTEIAPMYFLENPKIWWFLMSVFCLSGALAFNYTSRSCTIDLFGKECNDTSRRAHQRIKRELRINRRQSLTISFTCAISSLLIELKVSSFFIEIIFILAFLIVGVYMLAKSEKCMDNLHNDYGLSRN